MHINSEVESLGRRRDGVPEAPLPSSNGALSRQTVGTGRQLQQQQQEKVEDGEDVGRTSGGTGEGKGDLRALGGVPQADPIRSGAGEEDNEEEEKEEMRVVVREEDVVRGAQSRLSSLFEELGLPALEWKRGGGGDSEGREERSGVGERDRGRVVEGRQAASEGEGLSVRGEERDGTWGTARGRAADSISSG